jgi:hypothetical protein
MHAWSSTLDQPDPGTDPPGFLRGWNHVELANDGSLYATVALQALLKLHPDSTLAWRAELPVHHDLDIHSSGMVYALTEEPRIVPWQGGTRVLLDNSVTILSCDGQVNASYSLYDILISHPDLTALIEQEAERRTASGQLPDPAALTPLLTGPDARHAGREVSRFLRQLPGSPCDVLHANAVEILDAHHAGLWGDGDVLVSLRNLNVIAVLDLTAQVVRWLWGPGELSGQHQPSVLPGGTVLVFDNGRAVGRSRVLEIDPISGQIVWQFSASPPESMFSAIAGGCEELPGGTILISDAQGGRGIEVTRDGRTAWTVHISTLKSSSDTSRAEFYRMSAVLADTAGLLGESDGPIRELARSRLRCEPRDASACLSSTL